MLLRGGSLPGSSIGVVKEDTRRVDYGSHEGTDSSFARVKVCVSGQDLMILSMLAIKQDHHGTNRCQT